MFLDDKMYQLLKVIGWILLILMGVYAVLNVVSFFRYNKLIDNDEVTPIETYVNDYEFHLIKFNTDTNRVGDKNIWDCSIKFTYTVDGEDYVQEDDECVSRSIRADMIVYYHNDNPDRYFYEKDISYRAWLTFIWPIIGAGMILFTKNSYPY